VILIYLVVIVLFFMLLSYEKPDAFVGMLVAEFGIDKAIKLAERLASTEIMD
jgi:hypothetical protein